MLLNESGDFNCFGFNKFIQIDNFCLGFNFSLPPMVYLRGISFSPWNLKNKDLFRIELGDRPRIGGVQLMDCLKNKELFQI